MMKEQSTITILMMFMIQIYDEEDEKTISEHYLGKFFSINKVLLKKQAF